MRSSVVFRPRPAATVRKLSGRSAPTSFACRSRGGSGIAGLVTAYLASRDHDVVLVTKSELAESNTKYAQGGIAAVLSPEDTVESHIADTIAAGAGANDPTAVEVLCTEGPQRVRDLLPADEAEMRLAKRFAEFNVWRNIADEPVEMTPLGLVDSESLAPRDLAVCDLVYADRTGEIYQGVYNADHRWYYFPKMTRDEAILIKCYDSTKDGRSRFSLHSAFDDPTSPANPRPRQSIETRALAFFD